MTERRADRLTEPVTVDRFWRNRKGQACVTTLSSFEGQLVVDCRIHYTDKDGKLCPMRKGITLSINRLPDLARSITKAHRKAIELGLLEEAGE